jgi:hypothetical protein
LDAGVGPAKYLKLPHSFPVDVVPKRIRKAYAKKRLSVKKKGGKLVENHMV